MELKSKNGRKWSAPFGKGLQAIFPSSLIKSLDKEPGS